jgi:hypothetical protein
MELFFLIFGRLYPTRLGVGYSTKILGWNLSLFSKGMGLLFFTRGDLRFTPYD